VQHFKQAYLNTQQKHLLCKQYLNVCDYWIPTSFRPYC